MSKQVNSCFKSLPVEIILQILSFLDAQTTLELLSTCKSLNLLHLLPKVKLPPDTCFLNEMVEFGQTGNYLISICDELEPATEFFPFGRQKGIYRKTDRCITSTLPIHYYARSRDTHAVAYFEVEVVDACDQAEMRIGLVNSNWNQCRPPGSLLDSLGYVSRNGNIAVGTGYDDKFMFGPDWGPGDILGCGLTRNGEVFFTLNGDWIAQAPHNISSDLQLDYKKTWYCAFSSSAPCKVIFKFDDFEYLKGPTAPFLIERETIPKFDTFYMVCNSGKSTSEVPVTVGYNTVEFSENTITGQSLQSTIPINYLQSGNEARRKGFFYFEVVIEQVPEADSSFFSVGLAVKPYPFQHHIGWNKDSVGYHSDDGRLFSNSYVGIEQLSTPFSQGSIIGCGYEIKTKSVFFTKDGERFEQQTPLSGILYPSIAANSNWRVKFITSNLEEPFAYQEANL